MKLPRAVSVLALCAVLTFILVSCGGGGSSSPNSNTGTNSNPVPSAGSDQSVVTGSLVTLDGSGSNDANGNILTYNWSFDSMPTGSTATLSSSTIINPTFTADKDGIYVLSLVVSNGTVNSTTDTVIIKAFTPNKPIPDTGQTTSYTTTFGEDSDYAVNPMSFTNNGDGTVTDNVTGLMWQQGDSGTGYNWYKASGTYHDTYNPNNTDICGDLALAGYSDWRLPNDLELMSIFNYGTYNSAIDTTYFPVSYIWASYWTSVLYPGDNTLSFEIASSLGSASYMENNFDSYVRCVRGGQSSAPSFTDNGNGTVTDNNTGLMWQKEDDNTTRTWEEALLYCEGVSFAGYTDWRVPNIKELRSIIDNTAYNPAIDPTFFPSTDAFEYWSSTTYAYWTSNAWAVNFYKGDLESVDSTKLTSSFLIRCVR